MPVKDPYGALGLQSNADDAAIKSAYRKLARKYHPDHNQGSKVAEEKFKEINEAYQILTNPKAAAAHRSNQAREQAQTGNTCYSSRPPHPGAQQYSQTQDQMDLARRAYNLTKQFNEYARFVNYSDQFRAAAKREYKQRNPGLGNILKRYVMDEQRTNADALLQTLANPSTAYQIKAEVEMLSMLAAQTLQSNRSIHAARIRELFNPLEQRINKRLTAIQNGLDVLSGRSTNLRFKANAQPS